MATYYTIEEKIFPFIINQSTIIYLQILSCGGDSEPISPPPHNRMLTHPILCR